jgi:hypothetical protein
MGMQEVANLGSNILEEENSDEEEEGEDKAPADLMEEEWPALGS